VSLRRVDPLARFGRASRFLQIGIGAAVVILVAFLVRWTAVNAGELPAPQSAGAEHEGRGVPPIEASRAAPEPPAPIARASAPPRTRDDAADASSKPAPIAPNTSRANAKARPQAKNAPRRAPPAPTLKPSEIDDRIE
jgi:hypothetical protein